MSKAVEEVRARQALAKSRKNNAIVKRKQLGVRVDSVTQTRKATQSREFSFDAQFEVILICDGERRKGPVNGTTMHQICRLWRAYRLGGYAHPVPQKYTIYCSAKDEMDAYNKVTRAIELWVEHGEARN